MGSSLTKYFGVSAISSSLRHFFIGKGFTIVSSLSVVFLLARYLEQKEYAVFISWQAIILVVGIVTTAGIQAVMHRYLPELRSNANNKLVYRMIVIGVISRLLFMLLTVMTLLYFLPNLVEFLNQTQWQWLLPWYLCVGLIRLVSLSLAQAMEALLWQRISQYSLAIASMAKLSGVLLCILMGKMSLLNIVIVESISESLLLLLLVRGLYKNWSKDPERSQGSGPWWKFNNKRVFKYGSTKYLVNLSMLLYGSGPNRLLASSLMPNSEVALFGFADSLFQLFQRFMPSRLLLGLVRPVFIANYSTTGDFKKLTQMSNLLLRINMFILIIAAVAVAVIGQPIFDWITNGKYGSANLLLAGFLILLVFEGLRLIIEILIEAVEKNQISILCNLVQSLSFLIAIPLLPLIGLWGLVIANILGTVTAIFLAISRLRSFGFHFSIDTLFCSLIVFYGIIAGFTGWLVLNKFNSIVIAGAAIGGVYLLLCLLKPPFHKSEITKLINVVMKRKIKPKSNTG